MAADIFFDILGPILLMVLLGAVLRWKFHLDLSTLAKINIYLFVPAFIFDRVSTSILPWSEMGGIVAVSLIQVALLGGLVWLIGKMFQVHYQTLAAIALAVMFYNSGNFGLPLAELAYPSAHAAQTGKDGGATQTFVMMTQNLLTFTLGLAIAAWAGSGQDIRKSIHAVLRLPMLPALAAALIARWYSGGEREALPTMITETARYLAQGLVPIALVTLGAQLASNPRRPRWKPVLLVIGLRLIVAPIIMVVQLWVFHRLGWGPLNLWPWPAELIILTAAVPTAVNTLLLTLELKGDAALAADCVFWTTVASLVTITGWLLVLRIWM
jgi:malate permease and related proteins